MSAPGVPAHRRAGRLTPTDRPARPSDRTVPRRDGVRFLVNARAQSVCPPRCGAPARQTLRPWGGTETNLPVVRTSSRVRACRSEASMQVAAVLLTTPFGWSTACRRQRVARWDGHTDVHAT